jgi:hypothetical protein
MPYVFTCFCINGDVALYFGLIFIIIKMSIIRPAAAADLESTQQLYYFIDDIRSLKILETEP